ncbi:arsenate reductase/protein-tyrosine-phosphatase family protein [Geodermatophilus sp. SYSU D00700]
MRILFVCTGNLCRSPIAEHLAKSWAWEKLSRSPEKADVQITSAGLSAATGRLMDPHAAAALTEHGVSPEGFRSRAYTPELAEAADLVVTMTRQQRRAVLETTPRGLRRTFTLTEAADLLSWADLGGLDLLPLTPRARHLGVRLDAARSTRITVDDDIRDPIGERSSVHREVAGVIAVALRPLADILFTSVRSRLPAPVAL